MRPRTNTPPVTERTLREVARLRRAEIEREADRALLEAEHDVEMLERLQSLRSPARARRWSAGPGRHHRGLRAA